MVCVNCTHSLVWEPDFPPVYGHTSISFLKQCEGYGEAKFGDMRAALKVVERCINSQIVAELKRKYPNATLLPVVTNNKLPEALAKAIGMKTCTKVYSREVLCRKSLSAMERLLHKPVFEGKIVKGERYIIVDDIVTQGGTVSALRKYVIANGGAVDAIVTLSYSVGSKVLAPSQEDIFSLTNKYSPQHITSILRHYNIAYDLWELTRSQIKYLLLFKGLEGLIKKIEKTQRKFPIFWDNMKNGSRI